ncbi:hypothetical protein Zmor_000669 [Zophobas morio]|uniref:Odorant receptor n=1 Tax=Zophobas morio TaxID=2755281 RepID=A0AA38J565_9CUCU|nr:hypothetical protein Zmor_000669 [Zophobas morio]
MDTFTKTSLDGDDLITIPLKFLWYAHLHPSLSSARSTVHNTFTITLTCLVIALAVKGIQNTYNEDIFFAAECLQTCLLTVHVIGKILIMRVQRNAIRELVSKKSVFWRPEDFTEETQKEYLIVIMRVRKIMRYYYTLALTTVLLYDLQPVLAGTLPIACYVPPFSFKYLVVVVWYLSFVTCVTICGIDSFFCSLAACIWLQFKLLHSKIKENDIYIEQSQKKAWTEVKESVDHHVFLLGYCESLNTTFQGMFLIQFLLAVLNGALGMFIFMQPGVWSNRLKCFAYFVRTISESAFYCLPAEFLANSANEVGDVVYESKWYNINKEQIKKCYTLLMMKSQKSLIFSAYGLIWINLRTLVVIYKTIFSYFTYLNSTK